MQCHILLYIYFIYVCNIIYYHICLIHSTYISRSPGGSDGKVSVYQCGRPGFDPWVGKIPWRRKWQPTPVFLPGESQGWGSVVGYHLQGRTESDTTEVT